MNKRAPPTTPQNTLPLSPKQIILGYSISIRNLPRPGSCCTPATPRSSSYPSNTPTPNCTCQITFYYASGTFCVYLYTYIGDRKKYTAGVTIANGHHTIDFVTNILHVITAFADIRDNPKDFKTMS